MDITSECVDNVILYEYTSAAEPVSDKIKPEVFDFSTYNKIGNNEIYKSPTLKINYLNLTSEPFSISNSNSSSHLFYVINGSGSIYFDNNIIRWEKEDILTIPFSKNILIISNDTSKLVWANDEAINEYLGSKAYIKSFKPTLYKREILKKFIKEANQEVGAENRNRNGVLLSNQQITRLGINTLTHTMWSLLNVINGNTIQKPHRHNSIAIDLCLSAEENKVYTLMGKYLGDDGLIKNPIKRYWKANTIFITPPGWWHSHHNESNTEAWVFPIQDAGLYTYMNTLDIRFVN